MISNFDTTQNFWTVNKDVLDVLTFSNFYQKDKSKDKNKSSRMMWAITLHYHPRSKWHNLSMTERLELINSDFLTDEKLDPDNIHLNLVSAFKKHVLTRIQRIASEWSDKLDERFEFLASQKYNFDNAKELDEFMSRTDKLWKMYITCMKDLETESAESQIQGGAVESLLESGVI